MDEDLEQMTRDDLISEVKKLREGIRKHRDSTGHELCWHHPVLWDCYPKEPIPSHPFPIGLSFSRLYALLAVAG